MAKISSSRFCNIDYVFYWSLFIFSLLIFTFKVNGSILISTNEPIKNKTSILQATEKLKSNLPNDAINILLKIKLNSSTQEDLKLAFSVNSLLGDCYSRFSDKKLIAMQNYQEAKNLAAKLKDLLKLGDIYHKIGLCSFEMGKIEDARKAFNLAIECKTHLYGKDHISLALEYNGIGSLYFFAHNLDKALENYKKALFIGVKFKAFYPDNAMFYQNVAIVYASNGDYDNASLYFKYSGAVNKNVYGEKSLAIAQFYL